MNYFQQFAKTFQWTVRQHNDEPYWDVLELHRASRPLTPSERGNPDTLVDDIVYDRRSMQRQTAQVELMTRLWMESEERNAAWERKYDTAVHFAEFDAAQAEANEGKYT